MRQKCYFVILHRDYLYPYNVIGLIDDNPHKMKPENNKYPSFGDKKRSEGHCTR